MAEFVQCMSCGFKGMVVIILKEEATSHEAGKKTGPDMIERLLCLSLRD